MPICNRPDRGCNITSRESGQTSLWSDLVRERLTNRLKEGKQMTMETTETFVSDPSIGATTDSTLTWHQMNWRRAERTVRRLQTRIAVRP
jgi:hypothetical protein